MKPTKARFCSPKCRGAANRRTAHCAQPDCGKLFHQVKPENKSCSRECSWLGMKHRHTPETEAKITALWDEGLTVRKIGEATGLTMDAVDHLRARLRLPLRIIRRKPEPCEMIEKAPFRIAVPERITAGPEPLPPMHHISWGAIAL